MPWVFIFFCVCVLIGVSLIIIGLSKPGDNFLIDLAIRMHKKYFPIIVLTLIAVLTISAAAWAGELSALFSKSELNEMKLVAQKAYPRGAKVDIAVDDDLFGFYTLVTTFTGNGRQCLQFRIYLDPPVAIFCGADHDGAKKWELVTDKIIVGIERIINQRPVEALGNIK